MGVIVPTVGRKVWYRPGGEQDLIMSVNGQDPLDATIVAVHSDKMVNLVVFDSNGTQFVRHSVELVQAEDTKPDGIGFCHWMPYQIGQAAKTEEVMSTAMVKPVPIGKSPKTATGDVGE